MSSFGFANPPLQSCTPASLGISGMLPVSKGMMCNISTVHGGAGQGLQRLGVHHQDMKDAISQPMISTPLVNSRMDGAVVSSPELQPVGDGRLSSMLIPNSPTMPSKSNGFQLNQGLGSIAELGMFGNLPPESGLQGAPIVTNTCMGISRMPGMMGGMEMNEGSLNAFQRYPSIVPQGIRNHGSTAPGRGEHEFGMARLSAMW